MAWTDCFERHHSDRGQNVESQACEIVAGRRQSDLLPISHLAIRVACDGDRPFRFLARLFAVRSLRGALVF